MEEIFYEHQDESTGRFIVVEEENNSIWTYLTFPNDTKIDKDCFLGSRIKIDREKLDFSKIRKTHTPPPITNEYSTNESFLPKLREENFSVEWINYGNVILKINGNPFLFFANDESKGFSKSISKNGIYGNSWEESKFIEIMK